MQRRRLDEKIPFDRMIGPTDTPRLHHGAWGGRRIAQALCHIIMKAARGCREMGVIYTIIGGLRPLGKNSLDFLASK